MIDPTFPRYLSSSSVLLSADVPFLALRQESHRGRCGLSLPLHVVFPGRWMEQRSHGSDRWTCAGMRAPGPTVDHHGVRFWLNNDMVSSHRPFACLKHESH